MTAGQRGGVPDELHHLADEFEQLIPNVNAQCDSGRLTPWPAGMQPTRDVPEPLDEESFAGVVGLTEFRVVGEILDGRLLHLQQQAQQVAGGRRTG